MPWPPALPLALPLWCRAAPLGHRAWPAAPSAPRSCRQSGVGLCSMAARVAGIIAPLIRLLEQYHRAVPMAVFGSAPVLGGLLCFLLPETRGAELVDDTRGGRPTEQVSPRAASSCSQGQGDHKRARGHCMSCMWGRLWGLTLLEGQGVGVPHCRRRGGKGVVVICPITHPRRVSQSHGGHCCPPVHEMKIPRG